MKTYFEIHVPLKYDASWFVELRNVLHGILVKWQTGYFHITMAFLNETPENIDLRPILEKHLARFHAPSLTFDRLDVFTTYSGMFIVHLGSTNIPDDFLVLTEAIRSDMKAVGCQIDSEFRLHVTLGRINDDGSTLPNLQHLVSSVSLIPFTLILTDVDYRVFRGKVIYETKLNNNKTN
jgi:2'-5' RNA ligase